MQNAETPPEAEGRHPGPLVRTKLHRPPVSEGLVSRGRLHEVLDHGSRTPLTLVSAPAGYGKSMLVSQWAESRDEPCAWLSLDLDDSDPGSFARYLLAAVGTVFPDACPETEILLSSPHPLPVPVLGGSLVNELDALDAAWILVLDDYHRIEPDSRVHELLTFLLAHPPRGLRLVIVTRSDPLLEIASLRGRGGLTEIRLDDLRFTPSEVHAYLERASKLKVSPEAVANLARQTEGWIVGLSLVALHLRQVDDSEAFLKELRGGIQHTREYLLLEVLGGLPRAIRDGLLRTAVLDRLCPELCDAIAKSDDEVDGREFVDALSAGDLFFIPLDAQGRWFRYHHLFQELLLHQLATTSSPREIASLHGRASDWFEENDLVEEALQHALEAGDAERAARLVENNRVRLLDDDRWYVLEKWHAMLPPDIRLARPGLLLADAWCAYERFQFDRLAANLDRVDQLLDPEAEAPSWSGEFNLLKGEVRYWSGEGEASRRLFEKARETLPERHGLVRGLLELQYGLALLMDGEPERAIESLDGRIRETGATEGVYLSRLVAGLYFVQHLSGNLLAAGEEARRWHAVATRSGIAYTKAWSSYVQACSGLHAGDLPAALRHFADAAKHRYILHARAAVDSLAGLALAQHLTRQEDAAAETLERLSEFALELGDTQYLSVARSARARLALCRGESTSAVEWARSVHEEPSPSGLFMWLEVPAITQARAWIAEGSEESLEEAIDLLARIRRQSEGCRFTNQVIEVAVLETLALERQGRSDEALESLDSALGLAGPGGWIRPFVEAGRPMAAMLGRLPGPAVPAGFVERIGPFEGDAPAPPSARTLYRPGEGPPVDLLTDREQEVLELLAERLLYKEIATRLFISPQTVNSHLKNVYGKLHVNNRRQAVAKARELGFLPPA